MITHEDLLDARLIEALDAGDLDTALRLWSETSSSPGQEERFYALVKNWAAEPEPVALGIRAAELISGFPGTTGLRPDDTRAHLALAVCQEVVPTQEGVEGLRFWLADRGLSPSNDYVRGLWRKLMGMTSPALLTPDYTIAARSTGEDDVRRYPEVPPEPSPPVGPVR